MTNNSLQLKRSQHTYENGLLHIHIQVPFLKTTAVALVTRAGSIHEKEPEQYGAAHFLEHMLFNGSKRWQSEEAATKHYSKYGVIENAWTYYEMTRYFIIAPNNAVKDAMPVLFDRFFFPILDPKLIEKEKGIILEERKMGESENLTSLYNFLREYHYPEDSTYNHRTIGTEESIGNMSLDVLRSFHDDYYSSGQAVLFTYGGLSEKEIKQYVTEIIEKYNIVPTSSDEIFIPKNPLDFDVKPDPLFVSKNIDTSYLISRGDLPPIKGAKEYAALEIFNSIASLGKGSLLQKELIVNQGLASTASIEVDPKSDRTLYYELITTMEDDYNKVFDETRKLTLQSADPSQKNFERGKGYIIGKQLRMAESTMDMIYGSHFDVDVRTTYPGQEPFSFNDLHEAIKNMSLDEYVAIVKKLFENLQTSYSVLGRAAKFTSDCKSGKIK